MQQDLCNRQSWSEPGALRWLSGLQGFTDAGEQAAYWRIADEMRNQPILDLGVGGGRTTLFLRSLSEHYVGIDYLQPMVDSARARYPFADIRIGDARDLSRFEDESFALVVFSYAGIDAVDRNGRRQILREIHRVLRPGGLFWFSTLNKDGVGPRERPWRLKRPRRGAGLINATVQLLQSVREAPRSIRNYMRLKQLRWDGDGWVIAPNAAHCYGLLVHYTTLADQLRELHSASFRDETFEAFDNHTGRRVHPGEDLSGVVCFNVLVRK